ncbi:NAD(P)-dependent oxidoreductase [Actinoplanes derwentensis]|uniref:Putative NADH-flavin reductase n=1 Tax=Actinoplanes derwentensis TaxID=113562 RepID=A0A1H1U9U7_9ACTN|nr:NAD(P)H-binding protein [Actinoplanes derwentensis]GID85242.1 NADH-flavin reductase [Actinoplanes derwentensis]SDS69254.1 Putative NADH-flavin reductase [Actinoplanes derwentensis]
MTVVVLGASGATGRHVVSTALERGHKAVALVRRPGTFGPRDRLTEVIWPDVTDTAALVHALPGADVVVSALGGAGKGPTTVCSDGIGSAVTAMNTAGVTRLIAVSAHGVLETHDRSLYSVAVWANVAERMRDKETMEPLITASGLNWTIVRPPKLSSHAAIGRYTAGTDLLIRLWSAIGRADLAAFLIDEAETPRYAHAYPRITR